jgi:hypothetical protein
MFSKFNNKSMEAGREELVRERVMLWQIELD